MGKCLSTYDKMLACIRKYPKHEFYQTHIWEGKLLVKGIMGDEKNQCILIDDIKNKIILDLGCATGATSLWAIENGAKKIIGIDSGYEQINIFSELISCIDKKYKFNVYIYDLKRKLPDNIIIEKIDTIFCFAITQYIGYREIWKEVPSAKVIYVMGGVDSNYTEQNLSDEKYDAEFIAFLPNNNTDKRLQRKMFRLEKIA